LFSAAYYFGFYKGVLVNAALYNLQSNLNKTAQPLAVKYGVKKLDDYIPKAQT
jgi:hypothetical protein